MPNNYKRFEEDTGIKFSYDFIVDTAPFEFLFEMRKREICVCATHSNMEYLVKILKKSNIVNATTPNAFIKHIWGDGHLKFGERK